MPASADLASYGTHPPRGLVRVMLALTRALPANWLGLRISMPLRRLAINALGPRPVDVPLWGARARLYPAGNNCEKYALFTPQMLDVVERAALSAAIDQRMAAGGTFVFIDIGANVGLYSLFVAARAGEGARVLAIEPQPGILDRLRFNCASNPALAIEIVPMAVADREADIEFIVDGRDSGGSHLNKGTDPAASGDTLRVRARPLAAMLADAGMSRIDALKIDIEGAEDLALAPFLREAPAALLPALILIEDRPQDWGADLHALLRDRGYAARARNRHNVVFARGG